jgi:hypothetical protein
MRERTCTSTSVERPSIELISPESLCDLMVSEGATAIVVECYFTSKQIELNVPLYFHM